MTHLGEISALAAALLWSVNSLIFGFAVRRLGSLSLNLIRLNLAALLLCSAAILTSGTAWISDTPIRDLLLLVTSGWIGLTLGDWAYYKSLQILGPRLAALMFSLVPPITTLLGVLYLDERPRLIALAGMVLTVAGVTWVILERPATPPPDGSQHPIGTPRLLAVFFGVLGSVGQSVGLILTKEAMSAGVAVLPATAMRMAAGAAGIWVVWILSRRSLDLVRLREDRRVLPLTACGVVLGPVLGIWLSMIAVKYTQAGIAATLTSTMPVLILPLVMLVHKEKVSPRAALGAALAVAGVALIFARH